jgi:hypothetical protein
MHPKTSTNQGRSTALRPVTTLPRPREGAPKGKGAGVTLPRGQGSAEPSPTPPRPQPNAARYPRPDFWLENFWGKKDRGGVFSTRISPGESHRGVSVLRLRLTVPLCWGAGLGAGCWVLDQGALIGESGVGARGHGSPQGGAMLGAGCPFPTPLGLRLVLLPWAWPAGPWARRRSLHGKVGRRSLAGLATLAGGNLQN